MIYLHQCTDGYCKHEWEDIYGLNDPIPNVCPNCLQNTVKRLIAGASINIIPNKVQPLVKGKPTWIDPPKTNIKRTR